MSSAKDKFWLTKTLDQLSDSEWEQLCDGCGKCCLQKVIDDDTDDLYFTEVSCKLLDTKDCHCTQYERRFEFVPDCTKITKENIHSIDWLPPSCAYVRLREGKPLPTWHPLLVGNKKKMHKKHMSAQGKCVPESKAGPLQDHIVIWPLID